MEMQVRDDIQRRRLGRRRNGPVQMALPLPERKARGGRRPGAGRPRTNPLPEGWPPGRRAAAHLRRDPVRPSHPLHVTLRLCRVARSLRNGKLFAELRRAFLAGRERFGFRLVHFSVQHDHIHLVVEATDARALSRGMQGLGVRIARAINRRLGRRGQVLADRYHARALRSPTETRRALLYVLNNARKHAAQRGTSFGPGADPCSSGLHFEGWRGDPAPTPESRRWPPCCAPPASWLLRGGWQRGGGLIDVDATPGPRAPS
jgi:REP element-mobilizing transposase RayT